MSRPAPFQSSRLLSNPSMEPSLADVAIGASALARWATSRFSVASSAVSRYHPTGTIDDAATRDSSVVFPEPAGATRTVNPLGGPSRSDFSRRSLGRPDALGVRNFSFNTAPFISVLPWLAVIAKAFLG